MPKSSKEKLQEAAGEAELKRDLLRPRAPAALLWDPCDNVCDPKRERLDFSLHQRGCQGIGGNIWVVRTGYGHLHSCREYEQRWKQ